MNTRRRPHPSTLILAAGAALLLAACAPPAVPTPVCVPEYTVTKTADTDDGVCSADDCSLREAVRNANACPGAQTIRLPAGGYTLTIAGPGEDAAASGDLDLTDDLTIIGEGAPSIHGGGLDRLFEIHAPAAVRMEGLILTDGREQLGGAVRNHGTLTLVGLSIHSNEAVVPPGGSGSSAGGGLFNEAGTLTLIDTQVFGNRADTGGGIHNFATARLDASGLLLAGNRANMAGGGLWNNTAARALLNDVTLRQNQADGSGAGIYSAGHLEIERATFEENTEAVQGGGLYVAAGTSSGGVDLPSESFLYDAWFTNISAQQGGAVYNAGLLHLYRSSLTINTAFGGFGGGAYNETTGLLLLRNVTVSGNMADPATRGGAGVYNYGGEVRLEFATLAYNSPDGILNDGGGLLSLRSTILAYHALGNCLGGASAGYNLSSDASCAFIEPSDLNNVDPLLAPLDTNGWINLSHALSPGSPAIDSGTPDLCIAEDQRTVARPQGAGCDRGALEMVGVAGAPPPPAPTEAPGGVSGTLNRNAFCRRGPGMAYDSMTAYYQGEQFEVDGRSAPGAPPWWWVRMPGTTAHCWVSEIVIDLNGPAEELPVITAPPIPAAPTGLEIVRRACVSGQMYRVELRWQDAAGDETGYRVYRNGELLASLAADSTAYSDAPPFGGPHTYEVEAFNQYAASARAAVQDAACP